MHAHPVKNDTIDTQSANANSPEKTPATTRRASWLNEPRTFRRFMVRVPREKENKDVPGNHFAFSIGLGTDVDCAGSRTRGCAGWAAEGCWEAPASFPSFAGLGR